MARLSGTSYAMSEVEHKITPIPRKGQTRSGYGRRLPTRYLVRLPGERRWRRVLAICYSNAATLYVDTPAGWVTFY